jgi:hypothetical protein
MITHYKFKGIPFKTIIIPKGTVLFRGLNYDEGSNYMNMFNDLLGYKQDKYYAIDPNMNVFFYPAPYVSDSAKIYDIHIMYITQYDVELLLLVNPSNISRNSKNDDMFKDIITTCEKIKYNKCGELMNSDDPCFTYDMLKQYPQINGYIGIAKQDEEQFTKKYKDMLIKYNNIDKIKQILPSIISNSRGITSIPEIVIHPLRFRYDDCHLITERFYNPENVVKYCINNRAQYNFFPLLYFCNNGIYKITDLKDANTIKQFINNNAKYTNDLPTLYEYIDSTLSKMFNDGYTINNTKYKLFVDKRTGFYKAFIVRSINSRRRNTRKKIFRNFKDDTFDGYLDSYILKKNDPRINTIVSTHKNYIDNFLNDLIANGYSVKKKLVLDRGNKRNFVYKYYIDNVFERPDLEEYRNLRRRRKNITNKKTSNYFNAILKFNDFHMNNLDNISSVESDTISVSSINTI